MLGGFGVCNFTRHRATFLALLEGTAGAVYALFFTLAGAKLDLAAVPAVLPVALMLFLARLGGIILGSSFGCYASGQPKEWIRLSWMAFMTQARAPLPSPCLTLVAQLPSLRTLLLPTHSLFSFAHPLTRATLNLQAGVTLGLAAKVSADYAWGADFSTAVVAVVVLNQVVGPPLFKYAIITVGEAFATAEVRGLSVLNVPKGVLIVHEKDDPLSTELVRAPPPSVSLAVLTGCRPSLFAPSHADRR